MLRLLSGSLLLCFAAATPWTPSNDPASFGNYVYNFNKLPQVFFLFFSLAPLLSVSRLQIAQLKQSPWSDTYWPSFQSGIAHRWMSSDPEDFSYDLLTKTQLQGMTQNQLMQLSPAEKVKRAFCFPPE
jgi:hypothetical protein